MQQLRDFDESCNDKGITQNRSDSISRITLLARFIFQIRFLRLAKMTSLQEFKTTMQYRLERGRECRMSIRQQPGNTGTRQKEITIKNKKEG
jgi:hypothetical protein